MNSKEEEQRHKQNINRLNRLSEEAAKRTKETLQQIKVQQHQIQQHQQRVHPPPVFLNTNYELLNRGIPPGGLDIRRNGLNHMYQPFALLPPMVSRNRHSNVLNNNNNRNFDLNSFNPLLIQPNPLNIQPNPLNIGPINNNSIKIHLFVIHY